MKKLQRFAIGLLVLSPVLILAQQTEIMLCAPAGARKPMEQVISGFENKTGYKVHTTFGVGSELKKQVANGANFDLPVLPSPYSEVLSSGNVIESTAKTLASEFVGVAVKKGTPKPDITTPEAVKQMLLSAKSVAVGGGVAIASLELTLKKLGISDQLEQQLKRQRNSADTMRTVASGEAEFGITFLNEMEDPGIDVVGPLPKEISDPLVLVGFVSAHTKNPEATRALLDYLSSPEAARVYREHFLVIP